MKILSTIFGLFLLSSLPVCAQSMNGMAGMSPIEISGAWARATIGGLKTGAVYMVIANSGSSDDRLISAATPVADTAQVHQTINDNGVMKMRAVSALAVKAGAKVTLSPEGYHVMLMDLKQPLKDGDTFPLTLTFEKAGHIDVTVKVAKTDPTGGGGMGDMGGMKM
jgi:copper(I)-binding protein